MNTFQLEQCLTQNPYTTKFFQKVVPCDKLPKKYIKIEDPTDQKMYISNTDISGKKGTHWCCFVISSKFVHYFNSLGTSYHSNKWFKQFIKTNRKKRQIIFHKRKIQSNYSDTCGEFCGLYLLCCSRRTPLSKFYKIFSNDLIKNDYLAINLFNKYFECKKNCVGTIFNGQSCVSLFHKKNWKQ